jgi:hypothetical protein
MSWHYLQGQEEESWEESCLDGAPYALLSLMPTQEKSYSPDKKTEPATHSPSGMTSEPSTEGHGPERLTSLAEGSPARTSAPQERGAESKDLSLDSGWKWKESSVRYDPAMSSWRTRQCSLFGGLEVFSEGWPRWGMMRDGECWGLAIPGHLTGVTAFGSWLPTPTAQDASNNGGPSQLRRNSLPLNAMAGGPLNPTWVEWLMGWPIGWTGLEPLETDRFRQWLHLHGES